MNTIFADRTVSISQFKASPAKAMEEAGDRPVAVLSHNRPLFYAMSAELFAKIADVIDDYELSRVVQERLENPKIVDVAIDEL